MIRHAKETGRDGSVGTDPSMISGRQSDSKMLGVSDIYIAASRIFPISKQKDLPPRRFAQFIHLGETTRLVGVSTKQSVSVN
jgi:hypothetical protein